MFALTLAAWLSLSPALAADPAAPELATAPSPSGILKLRLNVPAAQLYVDHVKVLDLSGAAPIQHSLPVGPHTIRVVADNHDPFVRRVEIREGGTTELVAQLQPGAGTVEFITEPGGAKVSIDGGEPVPVPVRLPAPREGQHRYRIEGKGLEPREGTFDFRKGQNLLFYEKLASTRGQIAVVTDPAGARVTLDGVQVGLSPATAADTKPGTHRLRLDLEGYATQLRSVDNSDGEKLQVKRELEKRGTRFKVMSEVPVAVTLDEQMIGEGEEVAIPELSAGRYQMKVTAPGHKELTERVEVKGHAAWFEVELAPDTGSAASALRETGPFYTRWPFWTAVGGGTVVAVVGGVLIARAFEPVEIPSGDVVVVLP